VTSVKRTAATDPGTESGAIARPLNCPGTGRPCGLVKAALVWAWPDVEAWARATGRIKRLSVVATPAGGPLVDRGAGGPVR
jgi:hypothetical protein